jgi:PAS domain-containing protein
MAPRQQRQQSFHALLDPREAMTVAVRVQLSPSVVDTRIVAATRSAAELYGYDDPAELEGRFTSLVHVLEDIQRTRLRSTLRALGLVEATEHYEVRIVQRTGHIKRVMKRVEQRRFGETMVWICHLDQADTRKPFLPPPTPASIPEEALHSFFGWACVAEIEALVQRRRFLLTSIHDKDIFLHTEDIATPETAPQAVAIERLKLDSPRAYYKCRCLVCRREWIAGGKDCADEEFIPPRRCNYPDCRSLLWNDLVAAPAARRKQERRRAQRRQYHANP